MDVGGDGDATMQQRKVKGMQVLGTMERARGKCESRSWCYACQTSSSAMLSPNGVR